ncbi:hypothetical protein A8B75_14980 [Sphingomonadales bacterium EhC05]|nr:hypothetical protein A8B75_14980 [Sphingomonadales bacterium EhC05]
MLNQDLVQGAKNAAKYAGLPPRTIYALVDKGRLPVIRMGKSLYFRKSELDAAFSSAGCTTQSAA